MHTQQHLQQIVIMHGLQEEDIIKGLQVKAIHQTCHHGIITLHITHKGHKQLKATLKGLLRVILLGLLTAILKDLLRAILKDLLQMRTIHDGHLQVRDIHQDLILRESIHLDPPQGRIFHQGGIFHQCPLQEVIICQGHLRGRIMPLEHLKGRIIHKGLLHMIIHQGPLQERIFHLWALQERITHKGLHGMNMQILGQGGNMVRIF
jgi:hypothetical protein